MCRKNVFWGCLMIAFGAGLLAGFWLDSGFFSHVIAIGIIVGGGFICNGR